MAEGQSVADALRHVVEADGVPYESIGAVTDIAPEKLRAFVSAAPVGLVAPEEQTLDPDEGGRLAVFVAQLSAIREVPDAERIAGMVTALTQTFGFPVDALASVIGVEAEALERLSTSFDDVPPDVRTAVALRLSFVVNAINLASPRR